jgi:hypothetical protein
MTSSIYVLLCFQTFSVNVKHFPVLSVTALKLHGNISEKCPHVLIVQQKVLHYQKTHVKCQIIFKNARVNAAKKSLDGGLKNYVTAKIKSSKSSKITDYFRRL